MSSELPQLMAGYEKQQLQNDSQRAAKARWDYPLLQCRWLLEDTARRIRSSKVLFAHQFFRGDCHSHTQHSDGIGTVAETAEMARAAGLDFQFVTDHWGITQAPECREHGLWYGQEPVTRDHHLGILGLSHAFTPQMDFLEDYARAQQLGATVFVPHPTGWWPATIYDEAQKALLEKLPSPFLMEICNGANNIVSAFDKTDETALQLWDKLLLSGKRVHALGNTDAHCPHAIGMVWNGVFAARCEQEEILRELSRGHSFVSEAPLLHIALGNAKMGDVASLSDRENVLQISAADSRGLALVRVLADGEEVFRAELRGETSYENALELLSNVSRYVRVEVRASDGKRAYSNPIYFA